MPCNPAIGGTAKGHLVREIDALGGLMGARDRRDRYSVQAAQSQPRPGGLVAARAGGQEDLRRLGESRARARTEHRMVDRPRRPDLSSSMVASPGWRWRTATRYGCRALVVTTGTFLNGLDSHRTGAASGWSGRRAAVARSGRVAEIVRLRVGPTEDRNPSAAGSRQHRFRTAVSRDGTFAVERGDDPPVPFSFLTGADRTRADRLSSAPHERSRSRSGAREHRSVAAVQRSDSAASVRAIARRSRTRSSASRTRSGIRFFSSPKASTRARSTSTASR